MRVTVPPPTHTAPSASCATWTRPARPSAVPWRATYGRASAPYVARQGTALGRVHVTQDADGAVWVGGGTVTRIRGEVDL